MLKKLRISGFKAIETSGTVDLEPLSVFIGRNGSGKSSVLEFLELISNTLETDLLQASAPFRRGRDVIHHWNERKQREAALELEFDPEDISAGDRVVYKIGLRTDKSGERLRVSNESLISFSSGEPTKLIDTFHEVRTYRVPPNLVQDIEGSQTRRVPRSSSKRDTASDQETWLKVSDPTTIGLVRLDDTVARGGAALRKFLSSAVFLRLSPSAVADFAPRWRRRGGKAIDPQGQQTAELIASLPVSSLEILVEKLQYVTNGFKRIVSHQPSGPADQRYFFLTERATRQQTEIPAWVLSEGTRRLTAILALTLMESPPGLIAIEEIENGFDPWTLRFLLEELSGCARRGTQILMTTHSPYLMNMMPKEVFHYVSRDREKVHFSPLTSANVTGSLRDLGVGDMYVGNLLVTK